MESGDYNLDRASNATHTHTYQNDPHARTETVLYKKKSKNQSHCVKKEISI